FLHVQSPRGRELDSKLRRYSKLGGRRDRQFDVTEPDTAWASDFTFIRTHEGWMYLAVVIDLFSRQVVGWAMRDRADTELVVQAVLSAVWRRKPNAGCLFGLLKRERIRRRTYPTKDAARAEVFDYIEMFYNPNRRHGSTGDLSPVEFELRYAQRGS
ncbi:DDE-type integrase/transposase/recombinase, partial [Xanthomonas campestris pv. raphani]|uniref:DDE-type integrase/transposase/recombinase n=1 Tax=Xanthomonas campestris TaxID=339 RepID=UPI002B22F15C